MDAIIYGRWSTLEQGKGSTLDRQISNCTTYVEGQGWNIVDTVVDKGRSAYTGANLTSGNLGKLTSRLLSGEIDGRKSVLVVEELDRLSRQNVVTMLGWLNPLLSTGLSIAVTQTGQVITQDSMARDMGGLMLLMVTAFGSHHDSKKKAERVAAAWAKKRAALRAGLSVVVKHRHPLWVVVRDGQYDLHPLRARLVGEVFDLHLRGHGKGAIAKLFNLRRLTDPDYDTWGSGAKKARGWTGTYIGRLLHNKAALGWWEPHRHPRGGKRVSEGDPIKLYPPVVAEDVFNRANDRRKREQMRYQGRTRNLSNLLGRIARCGDCGGQMTPLGSSRMRTNKDGSTSQHYFLYCHNAKVAKTCGHIRGWTYRRIEQALLDHVLTKAMDDQHFASNDNRDRTLETEVFRLRRLVDDQIKGSQGLARAIRAIPDDDTLLAEYQFAAHDLKAAKAKLNFAEESLAKSRGRVSPSQHIRRVSEVRAMMASNDSEERYEARLRVKTALNDMIEEMIFVPSRGRVVVKLVGALAVLAINADGSAVMFLNMHKQGRDYGNGNEASVIKGYLRRAGLPE